jgi:hypothetical protein
MKESKLIIITTSILFFSFSPMSYAASPNVNVDEKSTQGIQKYHSAVSAENAMIFSKALLMRSAVANKLKSSSNLTHKAQFAEAEKIYEEATKVSWRVFAWTPAAAGTLVEPVPSSRCPAAFSSYEPL